MRHKVLLYCSDSFRLGTTEPLAASSMFLQANINFCLLDPPWNVGERFDWTFFIPSHINIAGLQLTEANWSFTRSVESLLILLHGFSIDDVHRFFTVFLHLPSDKRNQLTFNTLYISGKYYLLKQGRIIQFFYSPQPFVVLSDNILGSHLNPETSQLFESFLQTFHQPLVIQRWTEKVNIFSRHQDPFPSSPSCLPVAPSPQLFKKLKFPSAALPFIILTQARLCTHSPKVSFERAEWRAGDLENEERKQKQSSGVGKEEWARRCKWREAGGSKKQEQWAERVGGELNRVKIKSEEKLIHSAEPCAVLFISQCQRVCSSYH